MSRACGGDRREEVLLAKRLHEIAEDAGLDRARDELLLPVRREHHDRDRPLLEDPPRRLDPVELRHLHVEHREVGLFRARELDRLLAVLGLGAHVEARALEQLPQVEPDDRLVLGDEDPHVPGRLSLPPGRAGLREGLAPLTRPQRRPRNVSKLMAAPRS